MTTYVVTFAASARKELTELPQDVIDRLLPKIRELAENPGPHGCKKLHGYKDRWRIRAGDYRVVDAIDDTAKSVDITRIAHRSRFAASPAVSCKVAPPSPAGAPGDSIR